MTETQYVAVQALRFGDVLLRPGDPVPQEKGRSYHQMLALGQIKVADEGGAASLPAGGFDEDAVVVFVAHDGEPFVVRFWALHAASEADRVTLGLEEGERTALVLFPDDEEPTLVALAALLPGVPATRLLEYELGLLTAAGDHGLQVVEEAGRAVQDAAARMQLLEGKTAFLELLLRAVRTVGEPLPDKFPGLKELQGNGIDTIEGLQLLVAGEHGRDHLIRLDAIGGGRADKILAGLAALVPAPTSPVGDAAPVSDPPAAPPSDQAPPPPAEGDPPASGA